MKMAELKMLRFSIEVTRSGNFSTSEGHRSWDYLERKHERHLRLRWYGHVQGKDGNIGRRMRS